VPLNWIDSIWIGKQTNLLDFQLPYNWEVQPQSVILQSKLETFSNLGLLEDHPHWKDQAELQSELALSANVGIHPNLLDCEPGFGSWIHSQTQSLDQPGHLFLF
jgi:hypothetical protein